MTTVRLLATTALAATIGLTACSSGGDRFDRTATPMGATSPTAVVLTEPQAPAAQAPDIDLDFDVDAELLRDLDALAAYPILGPVGHLPADPEPTGPTPEIALRFLQRLQAGDWLGAARQLTLYGRDRLSYLDLAGVEAVMRDVLHNAGGSRLRPCTATRRLHSEAAVVRCGKVDVVVHTTTFPWRGVQISEEHPKNDVLATPHTHAYTTRLQ